MKAMCLVLFEIWVSYPTRKSHVKVIMGLSCGIKSGRWLFMEIVYELGIRGWHKLRIFRLLSDETRMVKAAFAGNDALKVWWTKGNGVKGFLHAKPLKIINQRCNIGLNMSQVYLINIFWWVKRKYFQREGHPKLAGNTIWVYLALMQKMILEESEMWMRVQYEMQQCNPTCNPWPTCIIAICMATFLSLSFQTSYLTIPIVVSTTVPIFPPSKPTACNPFTSPHAYVTITLPMSTICIYTHSIPPPLFQHSLSSYPTPFIPIFHAY